MLRKFTEAEEIEAINNGEKYPGTSYQYRKRKGSASTVMEEEKETIIYCSYK